VVVNKVLHVLNLQRASSCPFVEVPGDYNDNLEHNAVNTILEFNAACCTAVIPLSMPGISKPENNMTVCGCNSAACLPT